MNYQFIFDLQYTKTIVLRYAIIIYQPISGSLVVSKQGFVDLPNLDVSTLRHFSSSRDIPYIEDISASLRLALKDQLQPYTNILEGDANEPYFSLLFGNNQGSTLKVILTYDPVKNDVTILDVKENIISKPQVIQVRPKPAADTTTTTTTSTTTITAGGYTIIPNYQLDEDVLKVLTFLRQTFTTKFSSLAIVRVMKQVVSGMNYQFIFDLQYTKTIVLRYAIIVYQPLTGNLVISKQGFVDLPSFNIDTLRNIANPKDIPYVQEI